MSLHLLSKLSFKTPPPRALPFASTQPPPPPRRIPAKVALERFLDFSLLLSYFENFFRIGKAGFPVGSFVLTLIFK